MELQQIDIEIIIAKRYKNLERKVNRDWDKLFSMSKFEYPTIKIVDKRRSKTIKREFLLFEQKYRLLELERRAEVAATMRRATKRRNEYKIPSERPAISSIIVKRIRHRPIIKQ